MSIIKNIENNLNEIDKMKAGIKEDRLHSALMWYARLELGVKIRDCIKEQGYCSYEAEC